MTEGQRQTYDATIFICEHLVLLCKEIEVFTLDGVTTETPYLRTLFHILKSEPLRQNIQDAVHMVGRIAAGRLVLLDKRGVQI